MTAEHWAGVYEQKATTGVSSFQPEPTLSLELLTAANVDADDPILDVGAGSSVLVDRLLERGFRDLSVLDISPPALHAAQRASDDLASPRMQRAQARLLPVER